jgi:hypothetical protein
MADDDKKTRKTPNSASKAEKMNRGLAAAAKPPIYDLIEKRLRAYYDEVAEQPVPDRFVKLLNRLEAKSSPKKLR